MRQKFLIDCTYVAKLIATVFPKKNDFCCNKFFI